MLCAGNEQDRRRGPQVMILAVEHVQNIFVAEALFVEELRVKR